MIQYILLAVEALLLVAYPMKKTYKVWGANKLDIQAYRETVIYWIFFAFFQSLTWNFKDEEYVYVKIAILFLIIFKLPFLTEIAFKLQRKRKRN